jgi:hypothetical protein
MPRSKSKRKVLRHRWKVQKKHRLERQKAAKQAEQAPEKKTVRKR